jgi:predicted dehydrogenase
MRVGLVGCGGIARAHAAAAAASEVCRITSCADIVAERAEDFAERWDVPHAYESLEGLLEGGHFDLVLLATWPAQHLEQVKTCCRMGARAILCEKALAMNGQEGRQMQRVVEEAGAFLMEGLMYRHHPQIQKAKELAEGGSIGEVGYIHGYFAYPERPDPANWRTRPELGGGTMAAKGCYMVDALTYFAGAPARKAVSHMSWSPDGDYDVGHTATIVFCNGVTGQFEANHRTTWREEIRIVGTEGTIVIPHAILTATQPRHLLVQRGGAFEREPVSEERVDFEPVNSYRLQLQNVYECLFRSGSPLVPLPESVANLELASALLRSAKSGKFETVST